MKKFEKDFKKIKKDLKTLQKNVDKTHSPIAQNDIKKMGKTLNHLERAVKKQHAKEAYENQINEIVEHIDVMELKLDMALNYNLKR